MDTKVGDEVFYENINLFVDSEALKAIIFQYLFFVIHRLKGFDKNKNLLIVPTMFNMKTHPLTSSI